MASLSTTLSNDHYGPSCTSQYLQALHYEFYYGSQHECISTNKNIWYWEEISTCNHKNCMLLVYEMARGANFSIWTIRRNSLDHLTLFGNRLCLLCWLAPPICICTNYKKECCRKRKLRILTSKLPRSNESSLDCDWEDFLHLWSEQKHLGRKKQIMTCDLVVEESPRDIVSGLLQ